MINAQEAKQITHAALIAKKRHELDKDLKMVFQKIQTALRNNYKAAYHRPKTFNIPIVIHKLRELGYNVSVSGFYGENWTYEQIYSIIGLGQWSFVLDLEITW